MIQSRQIVLFLRRYKSILRHGWRYTELLYLEINPDAVFSSDNNLDHYSLFITQEESLPYAVYVYSVYSTAVLFIVAISHFSITFLPQKLCFKHLV